MIPKKIYEYLYIFIMNNFLQNETTDPATAGYVSSPVNQASNFPPLEKNTNIPDIKMMKQFVDSASKFPENYKSQSQVKCMEKFNYLLGMSEILDFHSLNDKRNFDHIRTLILQSDQ